MKSPIGTLCNTQNSEIQTEQECIAACRKLGITYLGPWNGPGDFPKCTFTEGLNRVCHFNTSPIPGRTNVNPKYAAICKNIDNSGTLKKKVFGCQLIVLLSDVTVSLRTTYITIDF